MISGQHFINGEWVASSESAASPALEGARVSQASREQVDTACRAARDAFRPYGRLDGAARAAFLDEIAAQIDAAGDEITRVATRETGLPEARITGERARTTGQLRSFADLVRGDDYLNARRVPGDPERRPLPRPDLRLTHRPIGPVAVFGASNFPLAFSVAGGDTASALAAGCPVVVKGHPAHPGTSEIVARAVAEAARLRAVPAGCFQMLQGAGREVGEALVRHSEVNAVGFTGSLAGGRALFDICVSRPRPIPFFGELGSVNPVFCLPEAARARGEEIARGWAASLSLGAGQFCTNPGIFVAVGGADFDAIQATAAAALDETDAQQMLTDTIAETYHGGVDRLAESLERVTAVSEDAEDAGERRARPVAFRTDAATWMADESFQGEVFGPCGIFVSCADAGEMAALAESLEGQLTATLQVEEGDMSLASDLLPILEEKAGRLLCNGFPTGVEVSAAMMHGGPYPASTAVQSTSVGMLAINRWLRPVSYQSFPDSLLHSELR